MRVIGFVDVQKSEGPRVTVESRHPLFSPSNHTASPTPIPIGCTNQDPTLHLSLLRFNRIFIELVDPNP